MLLMFGNLSLINLSSSKMMTEIEIIEGGQKDVSSLEGTTLKIISSNLNLIFLFENCDIGVVAPLSGYFDQNQRLNSGSKSASMISGCMKNGNILMIVSWSNKTFIDRLAHMLKINVKSNW